jgi:hypothetical protein
MSRGHEERLRQKFDEKMKRSAEKAKADKAVKQTPPANTSESGNPPVKDAEETK